MGNSLDFIIDRISSGMCFGMEASSYVNATEINFEDTFKRIVVSWHNANSVLVASNTSLHGAGLSIVQSGKFGDVSGERQIIIKYDPGAEFEYFSMETCISDGTLIFMDEIIDKLITKLLSGETYNKATAPLDICENLWNYNIKYTVGDFVINSEYGDFGTKDKPWLRSRFAAMLPIKCEWLRETRDSKIAG